MRLSALNRNGNRFGHVRLCAYAQDQRIELPNTRQTQREAFDWASPDVSEKIRSNFNYSWWKLRSRGVSSARKSIHRQFKVPPIQ